MSQFDESTNRKAQEWERVSLADGNDCADAYTEGRNSAKESLEILAKRVQNTPCFCQSIMNRNLCARCESIAQVKARGDWPLEEPATNGAENGGEGKDG